MEAGIVSHVSCFAWSYFHQQPCADVDYVNLSSQSS